MAGEDLTRVAPWDDGSVAYRDRARMTAAVQRWLRWRSAAASLRELVASLGAQRGGEELRGVVGAPAAHPGDGGRALGPLITAARSGRWW